MDRSSNRDYQALSENFSGHSSGSYNRPQQRMPDAEINQALGSTDGGRWSKWSTLDQRSASSTAGCEQTTLKRLG